jgi:hypothetical protein
MLKKTVIVFAFLIGIVTHSPCQDTLKASPPKLRINEVGLDITPFIKFYANFSGNSGDVYRPVYYLTYRHYFKKLNIRAAAGGNYLSEETPSSYDINEGKMYLRDEKTLEFRIGVESFQTLGKRWQLFYGIDVRSIQYQYYNEAAFFNAGYAHGQEYTIDGTGMAPLLGIRFRFNDRISLLTESSWMIEYSVNKFDRFYAPIDPSLPPLESEKQQSHKIIRTVFTHPVSLVLAITL